MPSGTVKWWNDNKGFGFITTGVGKDAFAHFSEIQTAGRQFLVDGEPVEFDLREGAHGPAAINIRRLNEDSRHVIPAEKNIRRNGVTSVVSESLRELEFDVNCWLEDNQAMALGVSVVRLEDEEGFAALITYNRL
jgi:CspA family cold shock protein